MVGLSQRRDGDKAREGAELLLCGLLRVAVDRHSFRRCPGGFCAREQLNYNAMQRTSVWAVRRAMAGGAVLRPHLACPQPSAATVVASAAGACRGCSEMDKLIAELKANGVRTAATPPADAAGKRTRGASSGSSSGGGRGAGSSSGRGRGGGGGGTTNERRDELAAQVKAFVESMDETVTFAGLTSGERFFVHDAAGKLGLLSDSDRDKVLTVRRPPKAAQSPQPASDDGDATLSDAAADDMPLAAMESETPVVAASTDAAPTPTTRPARSWTPETAMLPEAAPTRQRDAAPARQPKSAILPVENDSARTVDAVLASIAQLSASVNSEYAHLRDTLARTSRRAAVGPATILGEDVRVAPEAVDDEWSLQEPLDKQTVRADDVAALLDKVPAVKRTTMHAAMATVVGAVAGPVTNHKDDANGEIYAAVALDVKHPLLDDHAAALRFEVRAYEGVLARFARGMLREGQLVHVLGHVLPTVDKGASIVVVTDLGCSLSIVRQERGAASDTK